MESRGRGRMRRTERASECLWEGRDEREREGDWESDSENRQLKCTASCHGLRGGGGEHERLRLNRAFLYDTGMMYTSGKSCFASAHVLIRQWL